MSQDLDKTGYFEIPSLGAQDKTLNLRSSSATSVGVDNQALLAADTGADDPKDVDNDYCLVGMFGSDDVERVGAKRHSRDFQDGSRAQKRKVSGAVAKVFELTAELVNQDALLDAGASAKQVPMKNALSTAQARAKMLKISWLCASRSVIC